MFKKLTPNLMVKDVQVTTNWYKDVLQFEVIAKNPPEGQPEWAMMQSGGVTLMVQARESIAKDAPILKDAAISSSLTFYTEVEGLEDIYQQVNTTTRLHSNHFPSCARRFLWCD